MRAFTWFFAASGMAGLIYEITWTRQLATFVGHSAFAQAIVLFAFLGGMALGSLLVAGRSMRLQSPLMAYARVEAALALSAVAFPSVHAWVMNTTYRHLLPALGGGVATTLAQWGIATLVILPPSVLMGMTFPLASAAMLTDTPRNAEMPGRMVARLYGANSLGAALGILLTGFVLIAQLGIRGTLLVGGALNAVVALGAWAMAVRSRSTAALIAPRDTSDPPPDRSSVSAPASGSARLAVLWPVLLLVSGGTAVASYLYEIAWTRMLSLVIGSATHAFELMLSAFILGLAGGARWVQRHADRHPDPVELLGRVQLAMGGCALLSILVYPVLFSAMAWLMDHVPSTDAGYWLFTGLRYLLALSFMLPTTFCAGMTLPVLVAALLRHGAGSRTVGAVTGVNSVGAILGVALGALVLLPVLGTRGLLLAGAAFDIGLGLLLLVALPWWFHRTGRWAGPRHRASAGTIRIGLGAVVVLVAVLIRGPFDPLLMGSGVFRTGRLPGTDAGVVLSHVDGRTATVTVERDADGRLSIATNGKVDASLEQPVFRAPPQNAAERPGLAGDISTQVLLPLITLAHRPAAAQAAVIGHGSGQSAHLLLTNPAIRSVTTVEIEPEMVWASRFAAPVNWRVFRDARSHVVFDDARAFFAANPARYDLVMSEPSNPSVSGVAGLFTTEFYRQIREVLTPSGVFGQWLQLYESNDTMVLSVLAAVHAVFADYRIYLVDHSDVLIVAAAGPLPARPAWEVLDSEEVRRALPWYQPLASEQVEAGLLLDRRTLTPLLDGGREAGIVPNSDDHPLLDGIAERARFLDQRPGVLAMAVDRFDLPAALGDRVRPLGRHSEPTTGVTRSAAMAVGARLRRGDRRWQTAPGRQLDYDRSAARLEAFRRSWESPVAPADWVAWGREALALETLLHAGSAGVEDTAFHGPVLAFAERRGAPPTVLAVLRFRRAMARHDWGGVVAQLDAVAPATAGLSPLLAAAEYRTVGAVALFKTGATTRAAALLGAGRAPGSREERTLGERLLAAHLTQARLRADR